jgi:phytol kinase
MSDVDWSRVLAFVAVVVAVWLLTGALKAAGRLPCDVARKVNHALALAGGALWLGWLPAAEAAASTYAACGLLLPLVVLTCLFRDRPPFRFAFLANTRKSDAPYEAFYFWASWVVSMAGLAGVQYAFGDVVITRTAALLVGIGDGIAEPVGRRLGWHRFGVPSLVRGKPAVRSVEGCAAVFVGCFLTLVGCFGIGCAPIAAGLALVLMLVEAVSPHGLDNLTLPVASAALLRPLLAAGWLS